MKKLMTFAAACALTAFYASGAQALLIGGPSIIPAPFSVVDDSPGHENTSQDAFNEQQDVTLAAAIAVDNNAQIPNGGVIAGGTTVDSHMILLNTPSGSARDTATWTFDGIILGVMSDSPGALEAATTAILGATNTLYPIAGSPNVGALPNSGATFGGFSARGLEGGDSYSVSGNMITVTMSVSEPGDWMRVVTQSVTASVPEPASLLLMGLGLFGFGIFGVRRKAA